MPKNVVCKKCNNLVNDWCEKVIDSPDPDMQRDCQHFCEKTNGVTVQEWISVDDRLPEEGEYVLCVLKGFHYGGKIQVCKFVPADKFKEKPYFEHFRNGFPSVTHWMPLPQPPKGE